MNMGSNGEYEPSARDLEIYAACVRGESQKTSGERFGVPQRTVSDICRRVDAWLLPRVMQDIRLIRTNHTSRLLWVYEQYVEAWEKSKSGKKTVTTEKAGEGSTGKTTEKLEHMAGDTSCLDGARATLADIRRIWGVDKRETVSDESDDHVGLRVAGKPTEQAKVELLQRITQILVIDSDTAKELVQNNGNGHTE